MSVASLTEALDEGQVTVVDVVEAHLERIDLLNPELNLLCFVYGTEARSAAHRAAGTPTTTSQPGGKEPLRGVPYVLKDFTPTRHLRTTRGSYAFEHWVPEADPPMVERMRTSGAILVGKSATSELAHSSFTRTPLWGTSRNPWDPTRTPGGSSGGSAGAVASGMAVLAEGSDAGGSVRIPASCCGVVGFKPTYGRIPMHATPDDFDPVYHFGPIARNVDDVLAMFSVIEGPDERDPTSVVPGLGRPLEAAIDLRGLRVALSLDLGYYRVHHEVADNTAALAGTLEELGAGVEPVELGWDASVNWAWDANWAATLASLYGDALAGHEDHTDPELLRLVEDGRRLTAVELKSVGPIRTRQWERLRPVLEHHDILVCPTLALPVPPAVGVEDSDYGTTGSDGMFDGLEMTSPFNLVPFCPVISVPTGFSSDGLPTGGQIVGRRFADETVLAVAKAFQVARPWPTPPVPPAARPIDRG